MANILFAYDNWSDGATLTASSEATDFDASNTQDDLYLKAWRATGDTAEWLKWDMGSALQPTVLILKYHNLTAGATLTLEANSSDSWGTPPYQQVISITTETIIYFITSSAYQWWRLTIADASNPDTYVRIGRVFLGAYWQPARNFLVPHDVEFIDPSDVRESEGGQKFINEKTPYIIRGYNFYVTTQADADSFEDLSQTYLKKKAFFICEDKDNASPYTLTYYVRSISNWQMTHLFGTTYHITNMILAEER